MSNLTILSYKRKKAGKTDYRKRLELLKSRKTRLVVRKALNNILLQIVDYDPNGDKIQLTVHSTVLKKYGWGKNTGNTPSAYLAGLLCGKKAKEKGMEEAILDSGLRKPVRGSVIYAALKGVVDSGVKVPCSKEVFPKEDRLTGKVISDDINKKFLEVKGKILGGNKE